MNGDGYLTDDEKDADGDGLGNWDEWHGRLIAGLVGQRVPERACRSSAAPRTRR